MSHALADEARHLAAEARKALANARRWRHLSTQDVLESEAAYAHKQALAQGWEREVERLTQISARRQREYDELRFRDLPSIPRMTWADLSQ